MTDDDEIDDASLKSMRAVWLSMRDEEPPSAGMSALLAAAAAKADEMRDQPTWWARVFAVLRRPPALAFATVMILIGGAVIVTRTTSTRDVPVMTAGDDRARGPETHESQNMATETERPAVLPDAGVVMPPAADPTDDVAKPEPPRHPAHKPPPRHVATEGPAGGGKTQAEPPLDRDVTETTKDRKLDVKEDPVPDQPPAQPTAPTTREPAKAPEPTIDPETTTLSGDSVRRPTTPPIEQLARQAESAATRHDCAAVRVIVAKIKQQDASFFKSRLGGNAAIAKCL